MAGVLARSSDREAHERCDGERAEEAARAARGRVRRRRRGGGPAGGLVPAVVPPVMHQVGSSRIPGSSLSLTSLSPASPFGGSRLWFQHHTLPPAGLHGVAHLSLSLCVPMVVVLIISFAHTSLNPFPNRLSA